MMGRIFTPEEISVKYNFQNLMRIELDANDPKRLSEALGLELSFVKKKLKEFETNVSNVANELTDELHLKNVFPKDIQKTVAFVGDSITSDRESYFNIIKRMFSGYLGLKFLDCAFSGWRTNDFADEFYFRVLCFKPDIVSMMLGTNDMRRTNNEFAVNPNSAPEYEKNMSYMAHMLKKSGVRIILNTIPHFNVEMLQETYPDYFWTFYESDYQDYNRRLKKIAEGTGAYMNDMMPVYEKEDYKQYFMYDGMHLSLYGQKLLAKNILPKVIDAILSE